jgi:hypothetical protein
MRMSSNKTLNFMFCGFVLADAVKCGKHAG